MSPWRNGRVEQERHIVDHTGCPGGCTDDHRGGQDGSRSNRNGHSETRPKRHSGEMYDSIWELPADAIDVEGVKPATVRHILMAAARRTNPTRDEGQFEWFASVDLVARDAEVTPRSVQRVYSAFLARAWLEIALPGVRNGRARSGQERRQGVRSPRYRACLARWPVDSSRTLKNSRDVHVVTNDDLQEPRGENPSPLGPNALVATGNQIAATPTSRPIDSDDAGVAAKWVSRDVHVTQTRTPVKPGTPVLNPEDEPAAAARGATAAFSRDVIDEEKTTKDDQGSGGGLNGQASTNGHDVALTGFAVAPLPIARAVDQKPRFRCLKCGAWQNEPPRAECKNPSWHDEC